MHQPLLRAFFIQQQNCKEQFHVEFLIDKCRNWRPGVNETRDSRSGIQKQEQELCNVTQVLTFEALRAVAKID